MSPARFIGHSLLGACVLLAIAGTINFVVDPFQQYRIPTFLRAAFPWACHRRENPGIKRQPSLRPRDRRIVLLREHLRGRDRRGLRRREDVQPELVGDHRRRRGKLIEAALATGKLKEVIYNPTSTRFRWP